MLKNYLKIAVRNMLKQRLYSSLNVFGLTLGLACMLLIYFFVQHEFSYDRFHDDADQIHRIIAQQPGNVFMGSDRFVVTPAPLAGELKATFPEIEAATKVRRTPFLVEYEGNTYQDMGLWADSNYFDVFSYALTVGDVATVLDDPGQVIVTSSFAERVFGDEDPMGKMLNVEQRGGQNTYQVAGIMPDPPNNTHLTYEFIVPIQANPNYRRDLERRTNSSYLTYVRLGEGASPIELQSKLPSFELAFFGEEANYNLEVQALTDIHLKNDANFDVGTPGDIRYVYLLGAIGLVILLLACINYMNLAVARSMKRAREVGLRQVIGARRLQIGIQFISESVLVSALALGLALLLVYIFLPSFGELVNRSLALDWSQPFLIPGLIALILLVGIISGSYPALYMTQLQPVQTLKGAADRVKSRSMLQRSLIVFQYTASIALIAGSIVIFRQLQFFQQTDVGYERENIVSYSLSGIDFEKISTIKEEVRRLPAVVDVVEVSHLPSNIASSTHIDSWEGRQDGQELQIYQGSVGYEYFDVFGIELAAGRPFSADLASDTTTALILNEMAISSIGWSLEEAIGKRFRDNGQVVGVMSDFHMHSLHLPIAPLMLSASNGWASQLAVRIRQTDDQSETVEQVASILAEITPYPVSPLYMDDSYNDMYRAEMQLGEMFGSFTLLAVLIASMGLFGLAAYSTERRSKEVGVRKVLGASVAGLVTLLSREFLTLVCIAILFAVPLAYFVIADWLNQFAYRIELGAGVFILAALLAVVISVFTVSFLAIRAALANPVKSLKYE